MSAFHLAHVTSISPTRVVVTRAWQIRLRYAPSVFSRHAHCAIGYQSEIHCAAPSLLQISTVAAAWFIV